VSSIYVAKTRTLLVNVHLARLVHLLLHNFIQILLVCLHALFFLCNVVHNIANASVLRFDTIHDAKHIELLHKLYSLGFAVNLRFHLAPDDHLHQVLFDVDALVEAALLLDFLEAEGHVDFTEFAHIGLANSL